MSFMSEEEKIRALLTDAEWLTDIGPPVAAALKQIAGSFETLSRRASDGYVHRNVSGNQMKEFCKTMVSSGYISREGELKKKVQLSQAEKAFILYQNGSAARMLPEFVEVKAMGVASLLDASFYSIRSENLLVLMTSFRGILEHVGHFESIRKKLVIPEIPESFNEASNLLIAIREHIALALGGTRIHWEKLSLEDLPAKLSRKDVEYRPDEMGTDLSAPQVLNGIDLLEKKVQGARAVYEILCEFCHPNVGLMLAFGRSAKPVTDERYGFQWVEKELGPGAPTGFLKECAQPMGRVFEIVAASLVRLNVLFDEFGEFKKPLMNLTQNVIRHMMVNSHDSIWAYSDCPCGSGLKVRFCCGAKGAVGEF